jgi:Protein of unknown function (DUF1453)
MQPHQPTVAVYLIATAIVVLVLAFRVRRLRRSFPLRLNRIWIAPTIFVVLAAITLAQFPLGKFDGLWLGLAFILGAVFGWQRGRLMSITLEPATRTLTAQATPMGIYFLFGLIAFRLALRTGLGMQTQDWRLSPALVNDIFITFAAGLFVAQGVEMAIRARRLLTAKAEQASAGGE